MDQYIKQLESSCLELKAFRHEQLVAIRKQFEKTIEAIKKMKDYYDPWVDVVNIAHGPGAIAQSLTPIVQNFY